MHLIAYSYPITERGSPSMNTHDDDLRLRLGRIRNRGARYKGFFAEVRGAAWNEGYIGARLRSPRASRSSPSYFGRGRGGALHPRVEPQPRLADPQIRGLMIRKAGCGRRLAVTRVHCRASRIQPIRVVEFDGNPVRLNPS